MLRAGLSQDFMLPPSDSIQSAYISVGTDHRGACCWVVVTDDQRIECVTGSRALEVLRAQRIARGLGAPQ